MLVPRIGSLFKSIERLKKTTDMLSTTGINKPRWLLIIDSFIKCDVEEGILDV